MCNNILKMWKRQFNYLLYNFLIFLVVEIERCLKEVESHFCVDKMWQAKEGEKTLKKYLNRKKTFAKIIKAQAKRESCVV